MSRIASINSPRQQRLLFPRYGDFGFNEPVGRKHVNGQLTAIHKIIFNEEVKPPPRYAYNYNKLNLKANSSCDLTSENSYSSSISPSYSQLYPSKQESEQKMHRYDLMQRQSSEDASKIASIFSHKYDVVQRKSTEQAIAPLTYKRHFSPKDRPDSLDKIIDPYKNYQQMLRRRQSLN